MLAARQRAACLAQRARVPSLRQSRFYASASDANHAKDGHHAPQGAGTPKGEAHPATPPGAGEEPLGTGIWVVLGSMGAAWLVYYASRPNEDGSPNAVTKGMDVFADLQKRFEERSARQQALLEQAARDKHLLYYTEAPRHVELTYPEVFQTGSPYNVPAGHYPNLDKVVEHYRKQYHDEEERKAKAMAAKQAS